MRLLWLTPETPEPAGSGGAIRAFHQLSGLAERGVELAVVAPTYEHQARNAREAFGGAVRLDLAPRPASQPVEGLRAVVADPGLVPAIVTDPGSAGRPGSSGARSAGASTPSSPGVPTP